MSTREELMNLPTKATGGQIWKCPACGYLNSPRISERCTNCGRSQDGSPNTPQKVSAPKRV